MTDSPETRSSVRGWAAFCDAVRLVAPERATLPDTDSKMETRDATQRR
jgi:hypothetical protein